MTQKKQLSISIFFCFFTLSFISPLYAIIDFDHLAKSQLMSEPFQWTMVDHLFDSTVDLKALVSTYPNDHYKTVRGYDMEKGYYYESRSLVPMGEKRISYKECLSPIWQELAEDLLSDDYRIAMSKLTGIDLLLAPMEVNIFHYGKGAWLGPHVDLKDKIVTHVLYFNSDWNPQDGGCLAILRSKNMSDIEFMVPPNVGNSSIIVRSNHSWHAVIPVLEQVKTTRKSMTVTFYHPHSISSMWPPGDNTILHSIEQ